MKKIICLFFLFLGNHAVAQISASDISGGDFDYILDIGEESTIQIELTATQVGEAITRARIYGSGLSFVDSCVQSFDPELTCLVSIQVASSTTGAKRVEFISSSGQRIKIPLRITRNASSEVLDPALYEDSISSSAGKNIDLGVVGSKIIKTLYIKNNSNVATATLAPINFEVAGYEKQVDTCSGRKIQPQRVCRLVFDFNSDGLFGGTYFQDIRIFPVGEAIGAVFHVQATVVEPPRAKVEVSASIEKIDPQACLLLEGINPSECYFQADISLTEETTIGSVFCQEANSQCSVNIQKRVANEPVQFNIIVQFKDQEIIDEDNATDEGGVNPFDFYLTSSSSSLGDVNIGETKSVSLEILNLSSLTLPLPYTLSFNTGESSISKKVVNCDNSLSAGQSCAIGLEISPSQAGEYTIQAQVVAAGVLKTLDIILTGVDLPSLGLVCADNEVNIDGVCTVIPGCIDPLALNYDSSATEDNGTCEFPLPSVLSTNQDSFNILTGLYTYSFQYSDFCANTNPAPNAPSVMFGSVDAYNSFIFCNKTQELYFKDSSGNNKTLLDGFGGETLERANWVEYRADQKRCLLQRINPGDDSKYSFIKDEEGSISIGYHKCKKLAAHIFNVDIEFVGSITDIDRQSAAAYLLVYQPDSLYDSLFLSLDDSLIKNSTREYDVSINNLIHDLDSFDADTMLVANPLYDPEDEFGFEPEFVKQGGYVLYETYKTLTKDFQGLLEGSSFHYYSSSYPDTALQNTCTIELSLSEDAESLESVQVVNQDGTPASLTSAECQAIKTRIDGSNKLNFIVD